MAIVNKDPYINAGRFYEVCKVGECFLLTCLILCFSSTVLATSIIEEISPGDEFQFASHHFKWIEDFDSNGIIDETECYETLDGGATWSLIDERRYEQNIEWRRLRKYQPQQSFTYKTTEIRDLNLYVTYPSGWRASDSRVAIVWFYGGGWNTGTPLHLQPQADYFAERGIVNICVDYRVRERDLISDDGFTSGMDAKSAMRWIRANASLLGIDVDRVVAGGSSAGGHLAFATHVETINDPNDDLSINAKADALILQNPYMVTTSGPSAIWPYITSSLPPMWVAYGTEDSDAYGDLSNPTEPGSGQLFISECQSAGADITTYIQPGAGHGFCSSDLYLGPSTALIDDFLQAKGFLTTTSDTELPSKRFQLMETELDLYIRNLTKTAGVLYAPSSYDEESNPGDDTIILDAGLTVGRIHNGSWVKYDNFDFGNGVSRITVEAGSNHSTGGVIEVRTGGIYGQLLGTVNVTNTGSWTNYESYTADLSTTVTGQQDLYFVFRGGAGALMTLQSFIIQPAVFRIAGVLYTANQYDEESNPGDDTIILDAGLTVGRIHDGSWVKYDNFDFGNGVTRITVEAGSNHSTGGALMTLQSFIIQPVVPKTTGVLYTANEYDEESNPGDDTIIFNAGLTIGRIHDGSWIKHKNFNFGDGVSSITVEAGSNHSIGGVIEVRTGGIYGQILGTVNVTNTGSWTNYESYTADLSTTVTGQQDLYFVFRGGAGALMTLQSFIIQSVVPKTTGVRYAGTEYDEESNSGDDAVIFNLGALTVGRIYDGSWIKHKNFDFGDGVSSITVEAGSNHSIEGVIEVRAGSVNGQLLGSVNVTNTGAWTNSQSFTADLDITVTGQQDLYFVFRGGTGALMTLQSFIIQPAESAAEWIKGSWGVRLIVPGGVVLDTEVARGTSDWVAGAQEIVNELPSIGHVITNFTQAAHGYYFCLRNNPYVDIANEIHPDFVPSVENEQIILDVIDVFRKAGKKVILYVATDGPSALGGTPDNPTLSGAWKDYYNSKWGGDEYAAYKNLCKGFFERFSGLVDGYWLDHLSRFPGTAADIEDFVEMMRTIDPEIAIATNLTKSYFQNGDLTLQVDTDNDAETVQYDGYEGVDDSIDSRDYNVVKLEANDNMMDFTPGHPTPLALGAPSDSWAYEESTITDMVQSPVDSYNGSRQTVKHFWLPMRETWTGTQSALNFDTETAHRFVTRIVNGGAGITWANTTLGGHVSPDDLAILKYVNDNLTKQAVPYVRPKGAFFVGEGLSGFDAWIRENSKLADYTRSGDADGDGYSNLTEYAFLGDPDTHENAQHIWNPLTLDDGSMQISYRRRIDPQIQYVVECTETLINTDWQDYDTIETVVTRDSESEIVSFVLPAPSRHTPKFFIRIKVEEGVE